MNIYFIYNKEENKFTQKVDEIEEYIEKKGNQYPIKILLKISQRVNCDLQIILSDDINEISKKIEKITDKNKVLIITSNIESIHILKCIELTPNVTYLGNKCEVILDRINKIYEQTN